ncbi:hypothetical protein HLV35_05915 [Eggerthellaceae bacterium zg-997]|nr:hypothetical protein [Eggerthellaceae bacterium zg-997]
MSEVEEKLRKVEGHEEAVILDQNMRVIAAYSGENGRGSHSVSVPGHVFGFQGITITHNHPSGRYGWGGTFSPSDIEAFAHKNVKSVRAVLSGERTTYALSVTRGVHSPSVLAAKKKITELASDINRFCGEGGLLKSNFNQNKKRFDKSGFSRERSNRAAWQVTTGIVHGRIAEGMKPLESLGVVYYRRKR